MTSQKIAQLNELAGLIAQKHTKFITDQLTNKWQSDIEMQTKLNQIIDEVQRIVGQMSELAVVEEDVEVIDTENGNQFMQASLTAELMSQPPQETD